MVEMAKIGTGRRIDSSDLEVGVTAGMIRRTKFANYSDRYFGTKQPIFSARKQEKNDSTAYAKSVVAPCPSSAMSHNKNQRLHTFTSQS